MAAAVLLGVPAQGLAHTTNICWLVHGNGDVQFFAGTYHNPSEGLSGGVTVNGTRHTFTSSFGGNINELGLTNCMGGFNTEDGSIVTDPCSTGIPTAHWQTVTVSGIATGNYELSISSDSDVETPWSGCFPVSTPIDVDNPCAAFGDDDGDNVCNPQDRCPEDPSKGTPGICGCGVADADGDSDGALDCNDGCPADGNKTAAGTCGCGVADADGDSDGTLDCNDGCPTDENKTAAGACGCGVADTDGDADTTPDCNDGCPADGDKTAAGICGCGVADDDGDSDGTADCNDGCPADANKLAPGVCGCGVADQDSDDDGVSDCEDLCLGNDATGDADTDGFCTDVDHRALVVTDNFTGAQGPCTEGGSVISAGIDENNDGVLAALEVKRTSHVCHGTTGVDGLSTLIVTSEHAPGATCPTGGFELRFGVDEDRDGTLDNDEQDGSHMICAGLHSVIRVLPLAAGDTECGNGGIHVSYGVDDNGTGILEESESEGSQRVCNGLTSLVKTTALAANPAQCAFGGALVESGVDKDGSGTLEDTEVTSDQVLCNGSSLAVRTTQLEAGSAECPAGGARIDMGIDANGDETLSDAEVQHTNHVCEATLVLFETAELEDGNKACPHGGLSVRMGHDDGQPSGVAADGKLSSGEVESEQTICLAPTDVLINGGGSSCSASGARTQGTGWFAMGLFALSAVRIRRRRQAR